jgi:hypothetical protein
MGKVLVAYIKVRVEQAIRSLRRMRREDGATSHERSMYAGIMRQMDARCRSLVDASVQWATSMVGTCMEVGLG